MRKDNIILIGMPGSGKSTVGPCLAKRLGRNFVDTDMIIREKEGRDLKDIVNSLGYEAFLQIQEQAVLALTLENHVIATGGSIIYSSGAMQHLKKGGYVVYLNLKYDDIVQRLAPDRRLARNGGQSLDALHAERTPLYEKYADLTVECTNRSVEDIVDEIVPAYVT